MGMRKTFENVLEKLRHNHFALMAIACVLPIVLIIGGQLMGFTNAWLYPLAIGVCIASHALVMLGSKGEKTCH